MTIYDRWSIFLALEPAIDAFPFLLSCEALEHAAGVWLARGAIP